MFITTAEHNYSLASRLRPQKSPPPERTGNNTEGERDGKVELMILQMEANEFI